MYQKNLRDTNSCEWPINFQKKAQHFRKICRVKNTIFYKRYYGDAIYKKFDYGILVFFEKINGDTVIQILYGSKEISGNFCLKARPPKVNLNDRRAETVCEENYKW